MMYIAASHTKTIGSYLGDVLLMIRVAWEWWWAQEGVNEGIILSLHEQEKELNPFWERFIKTTSATVHYDNFPPNYDAWKTVMEDRRRKRRVNSLSFDTYKELYPRIRGGERQHAICSSERGLGKHNLFGYYWYGQESYIPRIIMGFGPGLIATPSVRSHEHRIFVAPEEKCQGNAIFTHDFWNQVLRELVHIAPLTVNTRTPDRYVQSPDIRYVYPQISELMPILAAHPLILSGNTGIGWAAGAVGTPIIACESPHMLLSEYSYRKCGHSTLLDVLENPDVNLFLQIVNGYWQQL